MYVKLLLLMDPERIFVCFSVCGFFCITLSFNFLSSEWLNQTNYCHVYPSYTSVCGGICFTHNFHMAQVPGPVWEMYWEALYVMVVRDKLLQRDKDLQDKSRSLSKRDQVVWLRPNTCLEDACLCLTVSVWCGDGGTWSQPFRDWLLGICQSLVSVRRF